MEEVDDHDKTTQSNHESKFASNVVVTLLNIPSWYPSMHPMLYSEQMDRLPVNTTDTSVVEVELFGLKDA